VSEHWNYHVLFIRKARLARHEDGKKRHKNISSRWKFKWSFLEDEAATTNQRNILAVNFSEEGSGEEPTKN